MTLAKKYRLKRKNDFERVFNQGKYYTQDFITIKIIKNDLDISRFGIIVSTKISKKAVIRNKIKRRISEVIRLNLPKIKTGFDVVILVRPEIIDKTYQEIEKMLVWLFRKSGILES